MARASSRAMGRLPISCGGDVWPFLKVVAEGGGGVGGIDAMSVAVGGGGVGVGDNLNFCGDISLSCRVGDCDGDAPSSVFNSDWLSMKVGRKGVR